MKKLLILSFAMLLCTLSAGAQGLRDVKINEILVKNIDNYEDDYGHRSSWVELHNTGHSKVDIGGCYFRIVANGETIEYRIPTGDPNTAMAPLGYCVFFCEGTGTKGTFYTNFTLENVESIALYNSSGKGSPIDEIKINYNDQLPDVSVGRATQEDGSIVWKMLSQTTPNATNDTEPLVPRHEKFRKMDPSGGMMALIAILVVMSVLAILFLLFKFMGNYMVSLAKRKTAAAKATNGQPAVETASDKGRHESPYTADEIAAIAMAMQLYLEELHDRESSVLTINRVARAYSPWSSKIYGLRQFPPLKK